jgi:hypothetical protein
VVEGVYTDDQYERMLGVVKAEGPWPTITAHHFDTVEELVATSTGVVPAGLDLTLDDIATGHFRGFFGESSICYHPELFDCFYNQHSVVVVPDRPTSLHRAAVRRSRPGLRTRAPNARGTTSARDQSHARLRRRRAREPGMSRRRVT